MMTPSTRVLCVRRKVAHILDFARRALDIPYVVVERGHTGKICCANELTGALMTLLLPCPCRCAIEFTIHSHYLPRNI